MLRRLEEMVKGSTVKCGLPDVVRSEVLQSAPTVMCTGDDKHIITSIRMLDGETTIRKRKLNDA